jgi:hypothetical protein
MSTQVMNGSLYKEMYAQLGKNMGIVSKVGSLHHRTCDVRDHLEVLDKAPRHDQPLDDISWERLAQEHWASYNVESHARETAIRDIGTCLQLLQRAQRDVAGAFRGELKGKTENALGRQIKDVEKLLATFEQLQIEMIPRQPYLIRQRCLSDLLLEYEKVAGRVMSFRKSLDREALSLDGNMFDFVMNLESTLFRVKATLRRLRDNPSQKMERKLSECARQMDAVKAGFRELHDAVVDKCAESGYVFFNSV